TEPRALEHHAGQAVRLRLDQGDVHLAGRSWTNAGRALAALGRIAAAEEAYGQALQAAQQDGDVRDQVVNLVNLGVLALNQGRYGDALTAIAAGLKLVEEAGEAGWTRSQKQILLNNRGVIYERIGEFRRALDDYKELLALLGPDRASVPYRINMAAILRNLGDPNLALEQLKKAEALLDSGSDPALMANLLSNVGPVEHLDLRRLKTALAVLERAYELAGQAGHPAEKQTIGNALADAAIDANRIDLARQTLAGLLDQIASGPLLEEAWKTHLEMARLLRAAGDGAGSIRALETAATLLEGSRSNLDVRFPSRRFLVDRMDVYARLAEELAGGAHRDLNAALAASERARQHLLLSRWRRHSPADGRPEKTAESLAELSAAAARSYENATPARLRTWREINQRLRPTRTDRFPPLPPQVAVVEFLLAGSHSRVFWRNGGTAGSLDLPLEKRLAGMVSRWLSALAAAAQDPGQERKTGWDLFQVLLQPVLARLPASVRRLWIVPDGGLWRLPWDALPLAGEIHAPRLVQKYELALLPSLAFASNSPTPRNPGAAGAYLFFGPPDPAPPGLRPRPGADAEAAALEQAWPEGGSIKTGRWATEGQFRRSLVQPVGLLHLATHAVVNPLDAGGTGIFFSRGQAADGALALRSLSRDDDGFLSLPEILHLDLDVGLAGLAGNARLSFHVLPPHRS
ncbi:MAG: CHAT domain-containing protein, partial [Acidobacteriota bacterium]